MANARRRTQRTGRTTARSTTRQVARNVGPSAEATAMEAETAHMGNLANWQIEMKLIHKDLRELMIISIALFALLFAVGFFL